MRLDRTRANPQLGSDISLSTALDRPQPRTRGAAAHPFAISPHRSTARRVPWPLVVLLLSIGLMAVAAFDAQRAVRTQRRVADRALREYASFAAWSYAEHLNVTVNLLEREAIGAVNHGNNMHMNPRVPPASELTGYLPWDDRCMCHHSRFGANPEAFLAIKLSANNVR